MAIYRNVQMSFWTDRKIDEEFSADEKYLYLFFLTNPMTNLCGCYEIGKKQIANMTGFDMKKVKAVMGKLQNDQKVILYSDETGELLLVNWHKYNWTDSEKFRKPLLSEIESVKNPDFREYLLGVFRGMDTVSIPYPYGMDTTVTDTVTDTDTVSVNKKAFRKPTVEEIRAYCQERKNNVDAQKFFDHYEASNWYRGKTKIQDWKACVRYWESADKPKPKARQPSFENQRSYDYGSLENQLLRRTYDS